MTVEIPLTKGYVAIVDDCDADLANFKWHAVTSKKSSPYARRKVSGKHISMHKIILVRMIGRELLQGELCDHIATDQTLNNCRNNLRVATHAENMRNRLHFKNSQSGLKGAYWHKQSQKWIAIINIGGRKIYLGLHSTPEEAHAAYVAAAREHYGEFANDGFRCLKAAS